MYPNSRGLMVCQRFISLEDKVDTVEVYLSDDERQSRFRGEEEGWWWWRFKTKSAGAATHINPSKSLSRGIHSQSQILEILRNQQPSVSDISISFRLEEGSPRSPAVAPATQCWAPRHQSSLFLIKDFLIPSTLYGLTTVLLLHLPFCGLIRCKMNRIISYLIIFSLKLHTTPLFSSRCVVTSVWFQSRFTFAVFVAWL